MFFSSLLRSFIFRSLQVFVLLIAQVVGGCSCCCLSRTLAGQWSLPSSEAWVASKSEETLADSPRVAACPKCRTQPDRQSRQGASCRSNAGNRPHALGTPAGCQCRPALGSAIVFESERNEGSVHEHSAPASPPNPISMALALQARVALAHPSIAHAWHASWQARACIWRI